MESFIVHIVTFEPPCSQVGQFGNMEVREAVMINGAQPHFP